MFLAKRLSEFVSCEIKWKTKMFGFLKPLFFTAVVTLLAPLSAFAANIYISPSVDRSDRDVYDGIWYADLDENGCQIIIDGTIEGGDFSKIKQIFAQKPIYDPSGGEISNPPTYVCLTSAGGSLAEAIKIAKLFKSEEVTTIVPPQARCESACSIIFMAGIARGLPSRYLYPTSSLGFHAPSLLLKGDSFSSDQVTKAYDLAIQTTAEVSKLGILTPHAMTLFTSTPSTEMSYVDTPRDILLTEIELMQKHNQQRQEPYEEFAIGLPNVSIRKIIQQACIYAGPNESFLKDPAKSQESQHPGWNTIKISKEKRSYNGDNFTVQSSELFRLAEESVGQCKVEISVGLNKHEKTKVFGISVSIHNEPKQIPALALWGSTVKVRDMDLQTMSENQFMQLISKHRQQTTFTCSVGNNVAKISNVQNFTNLRRQAGLNGQVIGQVPLGETVSVVNPGNFLRYDRCAATCNGTNQNAIKQCIDNNDVWIEVDYNGRRGFLSRKFLE